MLSQYRPLRLTAPRSFEKSRVKVDWNGRRSEAPAAWTTFARRGLPRTTNEYTGESDDDEVQRITAQWVGGPFKGQVCSDVDGGVSSTNRCLLKPSNWLEALLFLNSGVIVRQRNFE